MSNIFHIVLGVSLFSIIVSSVACVKVNPLPAPTFVNWGNSGPVKVSNRFHIVGPDTAILQAAFTRTTELIKDERWVPQTWEAPPQPYPPFPVLDQTPQQYEPTNYESSDTGNNGGGSSSGTHGHTHTHEISAFQVFVADVEADLQHGVDETYILEVTSDGQGYIMAETTWGALHALQTLSQLIISDGEGGLEVEQPVYIADGPKYPHRGVLYDTARNFYSIQALKKQIDALSYSKMNVFHWHITDSQSWPIEIVSHPEMTKDAYSPREVYTHDDVRELIAYGRERGVRVVPEVDMPGHSASGWLQVDKKAVACADSWWDGGGWTFHSASEPNPGQLDIAYNGTYPLIRDVYGELSRLFSDNFFHVGFDELQRYCYNYSTYVMDWFNSHPDATYSDLAQHYVDNALPIFQDKSSRRLVMWEDAILSSDFAAKRIPKNVIMQSWNNGVTNIQALAALGYDIIVSSSDFLYLDCGHGGWVPNDPRYNVNSPPDVPVAVQTAMNENPSAYSLASFNYGGAGGSWCAPYKTWQRIYDFDFAAGLSAAEAEHILGGEAAMWSEQADEFVVDSKVWPRTAAFGESLWSGNRNAQGNKRTYELGARILEFRERLVARGIGAAPLVPKYCLQHPHACDLFLNPNIVQ